ncbi:related to Regulator of rDNA transcription 14 [Saccharomycodes ludwigii]|uniref:Regulator of rDNA transcription 14 n=1 Tax=Saccharomycodes ludwigii TaxID=36035 RepID=A0A376B5V4_9ASCO|nr:hypothetical protein SCDLUD_002807 [Saccharomycodes ludwigii]KAH3901316.1 hypothetical protein SCDLUD_002807 [Saccharomycodes ludwigii]SSD59844.1 related to Regulator of rDNA transcription 14 [Saccharomycodes ludwigii]
MTTLSKSAKAQAKIAVSNVLDSFLPGFNANKINKQKKVHKKNSVQLISENLKKRVELNEFDSQKLKKQRKLKEKKEIKKRKNDEKWLEKQAKSEILKQHKEKGTLTPKEQKVLNKKIIANRKRLEEWDLDEDIQEELNDVQQEILQATDIKLVESRKRKQNKKKTQFTTSTDGTQNTGTHGKRYTGLTPGLAPVGLSDDESSDNGF